MGWSGVLDGLERRPRQPARSPLSVPRREVPHRLTARVVDGDSRRAEEPDDWLSVVAGAAAADADAPIAQDFGKTSPGLAQLSGPIIA